MKTEEILQHLGDLKSEAEGHYTDDGDDEIFHQDAEALQAAIDAVKSNAKSLMLLIRKSESARHLIAYCKLRNAG